MSRNFEDLDVWKKGCQLAVELYKSLTGMRDYCLKDQMTRAAVSIPSNIAEGAEKRSEKDFIRYLDIAKGSAGELRTQLYIVSKLKMLDEKTLAKLISDVKIISKMLQALQKSLAEPNV